VVLTEVEVPLVEDALEYKLSIAPIDVRNLLHGFAEALVAFSHGIKI